MSESEREIGLSGFINMGFLFFFIFCLFGNESKNIYDLPRLCSLELEK